MDLPLPLWAFCFYESSLQVHKASTHLALSKRWVEMDARITDLHTLRKEVHQIITADLPGGMILKTGALKGPFVVEPTNTFDGTPPWSTKR